MFLAENRGSQQRVVEEIDGMCRRREARVTAEKSKVMVFMRARKQPCKAIQLEQREGEKRMEDWV